MEYQIYTKKEIPSEIYYPQKDKTGAYDITGLETGKIDLENLPNSKWHPLLSEVPQVNIDELNKEGLTKFTVISTSTVVLRK